MIHLELEKDIYNTDFDSAIAKNMAAMEWAIDHCPVQYLAPMVDNKFIIAKVMAELKGK